MNILKKAESISTAQNLRDRISSIIAEKMQKYHLLINQLSIILLGVATIFIATEYQNFSIWNTNSSTEITEP